MDVLHVIPTLSPGGAQNVACGLMRATLALGYKAGLLVLDGGLADETAFECETTCIQRINPAFPLSSRRDILFGNSQKALSRYLRERRPDIIHSHLFLSKVVLAANPVARKIATVDTVHDNLPWWSSRRLRQRVMTAFDRYYANNVADVSVAISPGVLDDLNRYNICKIDRCRLIFNFIDPKFFSQVSDFREADGNRILIASRISIRKKGLDTAVDAVKMVLNEHPGIKVDVIGDGPELDAMKRMVAGAQLGEAVSFHGHVHDPRPFYHRASVLLMPSRWEGFGLTAAEALASGLPVVASRVGGLRHVVRDGVDGILCDPERPDEFAFAISKLLVDIQLQARMSYAGKASAQDRFSIERAVAQYLEAYKLALARNAELRRTNG